MSSLTERLLGGLHDCSLGGTNLDVLRGRYPACGLVVKTYQSVIAACFDGWTVGTQGWRDEEKQQGDNDTLELLSLIVHEIVDIGPLEKAAVVKQKTSQIINISPLTCLKLRAVCKDVMLDATYRTGYSSTTLNAEHCVHHVRMQFWFHDESFYGLAGKTKQENNGG
ncbi:hypothetical protein EYF80_031340 [Liparis tanakae]|uniref:Uncharacterized protein n=1 Tax=Liparis tanakae TaxID=230148 RepID=A0A4Z2GYC4_9TELE|nr:hypothetical protein EYF80_031340 [Liparis tanakae]